MSLITISLGSNINPSENLKKALDEISKFSKIKLFQKFTKVNLLDLREMIFSIK